MQCYWRLFDASTAVFGVNENTWLNSVLSSNKFLGHQTQLYRSCLVLQKSVFYQSFTLNPVCIWEETCGFPFCCQFREFN